MKAGGMASHLMKIGMRIDFDSKMLRSDAFYNKNLLEFKFSFNFFYHSAKSNSE